jgi:hypothetical protein
VPYITASARVNLDTNKRHAATPGELNYQFTRLVLDYFDTNGTSYQIFNDIIGALEGCKLELYRRKIVPYEDLKCERNGDVY